MFQRAIHFAESAHRGQTRKVDATATEPYAEHPKRVAAMVYDLLRCEVWASIAVLHDVLEDTDTTHADLVREFGESVANGVAALSDEYTPERYPQRNRAWRKRAEADRLRGQPWQVRLIKLCDCIDNARSIEAVGGGFVDVWRAELVDLLPRLMIP